MSQSRQNKGKGEVFPEITKAAPGPSPMPQDHVAKLKEPVTEGQQLFYGNPHPRLQMGQMAFPLREVKGRPGCDGLE